MVSNYYFDSTDALMHLMHSFINFHAGAGVNF